MNPPPRCRNVPETEVMNMIFTSVIWIFLSNFLIHFRNSSPRGLSHGYYLIVYIHSWILFCQQDLIQFLLHTTQVLLWLFWLLWKQYSDSWFGHQYFSAWFFNLVILLPKNILVYLFFLWGRLFYDILALIKGHFYFHPTERPDTLSLSRYLRHDITQ